MAIDPGWLSHAFHWFEVHTGTINESGPYYGFWSGFGSDVGEVTLLAGIVAIWRQHNCHTRHCWRLAKHEVEGTPYKVCRKCHPTINEKPTKAHIHALHEKAQVCKAAPANDVVIVQLADEGR